MKRLFACLLLPLALSATELAPWFGRSLEIEVRETNLIQYFRKVATPIKPTRYPSCSQFFTLGTSSAFDRISVELELTLANTPHRSFGFDNFRGTGRYLLLDDVIGDPISLAAGVTLAGVGRRAFKDLSSFHNAKFEAEGHLAFGREVSCQMFWVSRWWGLLAAGIGGKGCPWMRANITWERNFWDLHSWQFFVHALWGFGDYDIDLCRQFEGYGLIKHRSVDLGLRYTRIFGSLGGRFSFEFVQRVYAWNFPEYAQIGMLRFTYPFGL